MPSGLNRLTAVKVQKICTKGRYADGGGLYLRVSPSLTKAWVFRSVRNAIATEIGLGSFPAVSLAEARNRATAARQQLAAGLNPKTEKERLRERLYTFGEAADALIRSKTSGWKNEKTPHQWQRDLLDLCEHLCDQPVASIGTAEVLAVLEPMWSSKSESAAKLRMRLEAVLDYAKAKGWREGENPARWRGHLSNILPPRRRLTKGHHPAMPYADVPAFVGRLQDSQALAARGLEFLILTAARSGEVLKATWDEIDQEQALWVIPATRMKAKRDHRVPLSPRALAILMPLSEARVSQYVFPGQIRGKPLSNMAFEMLMKRMKVTGASPHGFRSSFRDWCGDKTTFPREIAEAALAHKAGDNVELAYRRGDALEKRRALMEAWAEYLSNGIFMQ